MFLNLKINHLHVICKIFNVLGHLSDWCLQNAANKWTCVLCKNSYSGRSSMITHIEKFHTKSAVFCHICGHCFENKANLRKHIKRFHQYLVIIIQRLLFYFMTFYFYKIYNVCTSYIYKFIMVGKNPRFFKLPNPTKKTGFNLVLLGFGFLVKNINICYVFQE